MTKIYPTQIPDCYTCTVQHKIMLCASFATKSRINLEKGFETFVEGELLYKAGDLATGFYFIRTGSVRTYMQTSSENQQTFNMQMPGDWLGFRDCMARDQFHLNAVALEKTDACFINQELIEDLVKDDVLFQKEIFFQLSVDWKATERQVSMLGTKHVHSRLAEIILILDKAQGKRGIVDLKINRQELASIIGMKVETLVRAIADLKARDYIVIRRNRFDILNREALLSLANLT